MRGQANHLVGRSGAYGANAAPMLGGEGMARVDDSRLVERCLAQGGFPRAMKTKSGVTLWLRHGGGLWRAGRPA